MEAHDELISRQLAHMNAARRLIVGMLEYPDARVGLEKLARFHIARAGTLAKELCRPSAGTLPCEVDRQTLAG